MILFTVLAAAPFAFPPTAAFQESAPAAAVVAAKEAADAKSAYEAIRAAYDAELDRYTTAVNELYASEEWAAANKARDREKMDALRAALPAVDGEAYARRFLDAAARYEGDAGQALFYRGVIDTTKSGELLTSAYESLLSKHAGSESAFAATLDLSWRGGGLAEETFAGLVERTLASDAPAAVKANVLYARASVLARSAGKPEDMTPEQKAAYDADMARVVEIAPDSIVAYRVQGPTFEKERLQVGMTAPNIVGTDVFGNAMSLEQFRGKVVVLDFWGDW
ncbi:MAG: hypothetical protein R3F34_00580 [Planctomycetota bacterium]